LTGAVTEIRFYHLRTTTLERALPQILEKMLARGDRVVVMAGSNERVEALNAVLWTYNDRAFLPHGSSRDGFAEDQPIWLTTTEENPNGASMLVLADGTTASDVGAWGSTVEIFDGGDESAVAAARERWKAYKAAGHALTYWKQSENGRWEKG
jgi:DNA polymerase-3 subunit chi